MKMIKFSLTLTFAFCLLPWLAFAGIAHYVDCSSGTNGTGTYASPWNTITSVNSHEFSTGDDVYFKVETTCTPSAKLTIDWEGTSEDRVIIGAYYGDGQFGLNGNARPIIDGNSHTVPAYNSSQGLIENAYGTPTGDYLTIQDLRINNSGNYGIQIGNVGNLIISNCYVYRSKQNGMLIYKVITASIQDNVIEEASYLTGPRAGLTINGANVENSTSGITVTRNRVFNCYEGIGLYKKVKDTIVEYNTVYDNRTYHIYIDASKYITIRYNLVYESSGMGPDGARDSLIHSDNEVERGYCYIGGSKIYGNLIAGGRVGITLQDSSGALNCGQDDNLIYNNTIVDCQTNFNFLGDDASWSGNEVKNNISWTVTAGDSNHSNDYSPSGVTWSHNNFDESVSGNAATNAVIDDPKLTKTSGWRSISPGSFDGTEWSLQESSINNNAGIPIDRYNDRIYSSNYNADTIPVNTKIDISPSIGAWMEKGPETNILSPPKDLSIIVK